MSKQQLIVAPRREARQSVSPDWVELLRESAGVIVLGANELRAQIQADDSIIPALQGKLGDKFTIEPVILHKPS